MTQQTIAMRILPLATVYRLGIECLDNNFTKVYNRSANDVNDNPID